MNLPTPLQAMQPLIDKATGHDPHCSYALRGGGDCDCGKIERLCPGTLENKAAQLADAEAYAAKTAELARKHQPMLMQIDRNPDADKIWPKQTHHARCSLRFGGDCDCLALGYRHVDPPIARAEHLQQMIRGVRRDSAMYKRLWEDTERLIVDYQVLAGEIPF